MREVWAYGVLIVVLAAVLNLPLVSGWRAERELAQDGVDVTAVVVDGQVLGRESDPRYALEFTYGDTIDGADDEYTAFVDEPTYTAAMASRQLEVRMLPDEPAAFRATGQQSGDLLVVITLTADLVLLALGALLVWRLRNPPDDDHGRLADDG